MNEFTPEQTAFEEKWWHKKVSPRGIHWQQIALQGEFWVSAALYKWEGDITIFAIVPLEGRPAWTIKLSPEDLYKLDEEFEILEA